MNNLRRTTSDSNIKQYRKIIIPQNKTNKKTTKKNNKKPANKKQPKLTRVNIENNLHEVKFGDYNLLNLGDIIYWHTLKTGKLAGAMIVNIKESKEGRRYFKVKMLDKPNNSGFTLYWDRIDKIYIKQTLSTYELWRELKLLKIKINTLVKILSKEVNKNIATEYNKKVTPMINEIIKIDNKKTAAVEKKYIKKFQKK